MNGDHVNFIQIDEDIYFVIFKKYRRIKFESDVVENYRGSKKSLQRERESLI